MMIAATEWELLQPLAGRHRLPGDVAMHPHPSARKREGKHAGEHFVQRDAERIEVAAGVHEPIHAAGLFGRHVCQCARDGLGRSGRLRPRGRGDAMPNPGAGLRRSAWLTNTLAGFISL